MTISATNAASTGSASLVLTINAAPPGPLFSENMGTSNGNNTIAIASNNFQNPGLTFTGTADVRNNTPLTYSRATGAGTAIWAKVTPAGTIPAVANLHIRFRNTNATPQFRVDDVVLSGTAVPAGNPTFGDWIGGFQVNGETGVNDDHDHDGLPNAIENILGTAPDVYSSGLTSVSSTANTLVFRHTRSNTIAPDLTASYEWPNLVDWNAAGASAGGITVAIVPVTITDTSAPDNDLVEVTATITGSSATQVFVRLKAVK